MNHYPCTCTSFERVSCKEICDGKTQKQWPKEKWIVFREFDSEEQAELNQAFLDPFVTGTWQIEKR
jgi:hypothetical protein